MPRSDEAEWWFNAVYEAVQEIPFGRVTSYGHIARLLGRRESILKPLDMLKYDLLTEPCQIAECPRQVDLSSMLGQWVTNDQASRSCIEASTFPYKR